MVSICKECRHGREPFSELRKSEGWVGCVLHAILTEGAPIRYLEDMVFTPVCVEMNSGWVRLAVPLNDTECFWQRITNFQLLTRGVTSCPGFNVEPHEFKKSIKTSRIIQESPGCPHCGAPHKGKESL